MISPLKAALLSGLVFPGMGQILQKHFKRGIALIFLTLVNAAIIASQIFGQMLALLPEIVGNGDSEHLADALMKAAAALDNGAFVASGWVLAICWVTGIVDACLSGRPKD